MFAPAAPPCRLAPLRRSAAAPHARLSASRAALPPPPRCAAPRRRCTRSLAPPPRAEGGEGPASDGAPPAASAEPSVATDEAAPAPRSPPAMSGAKTKAALGKGVNLFDPAATISRFLTRRFGIVGGLSFFAILAATEGAEIIKALGEQFATAPEPSGEAVALPSGVVYRDTKARAFFCGENV